MRWKWIERDRERLPLLREYGTKMMHCFLCEDGEVVVVEETEKNEEFVGYIGDLYHWCLYARNKETARNVAREYFVEKKIKEEEYEKDL